MLTTSTDLEQLAAVHTHAVHHNLMNTIGSVYVDDGSMPCVYIANNYDEEEVKGRRRLVQWARSITAELIAYNLNNGYTAKGTLIDGTKVILRLMTRRRDTSDKTTALPVDQLDPDLGDSAER